MAHRSGILAAGGQIAQPGWAAARARRGQGTGLAEQLHGLEQGRADQPAGDGQADRLEGRLGLEVALLLEAAEGRLDTRGRPRLDLLQPLGRLGQEGAAVVGQTLAAAAGSSDLVAEQEPTMPGTSVRWLTAPGPAGRLRPAGRVGPGEASTSTNGQDRAAKSAGASWRR